MDRTKSKIPLGWEYNPYSSPEERICYQCGAKFEMEDDTLEDEGYCEECRMYCVHCGERIWDCDLVDQGNKFCSELCHNLYRQDMQ
jgi:hypothetical protein